MQHARLDYRSSDGSMYFDFYFQNCGLVNGWRIYIISEIDYKDQSACAYATHRLHDTRDTYPYICWDKRIGSIKAAKQIASLWADATSKYISGEGSFDTIVRQLLRNG